MALNKDIFKNIDERSLRKLMNAIDCKEVTYNANQTISYSFGKRYLIGIMEKGSAIMVRYDYTGERTIVEELDENDIFSDMFISNDASELSVIAKTNCTVTFFSYNELLKKSETSKNALILLDNLFQVICAKIVKRNERIELLTARSIRNKLLAYFELQAKKSNSKTFNLTYTYTDLADFLAIDRSAMTRELKNLKDDKLIKDVNKKITLLY